MYYLIRCNEMNIKAEQDTVSVSWPEMRWETRLTTLIQSKYLVFTKFRSLATFQCKNEIDSTIICVSKRIALLEY